MEEVKKLYREIINNPDDYIIIVPNFEKVIELKKFIFDISGKNVIRLPTISTPLTLAKELSGKDIIKPIKKLAIASNILNQTEFNQPSIIRLATLFLKKIKELKHHQVNIENLKREIEKYEFKSQASKDRCKLFLYFYERYNEFLYKYNLIDELDAFNQAVLPQKNIILDSFIDLTPLEKKFILTSKNLTAITLSENFIPEEYELEKEIYNTNINELKEKGKVIKIQKRIEQEEYYIFPSDIEEVKYAAQLIVTELNKNLEPHQIMVVYPTIDTYRPLVKRVFSRYNIPLRILPGIKLSKEPAFRAILNVFDLYENPDIHKLLNVILSQHFSLYEIWQRYFKDMKYVDVDEFFLRKIEIIKDITQPRNLKDIGDAIKKILKKFNWLASEECHEVLDEILLEMDGEEPIISPYEFLSEVFENYEIERALGDGVLITGAFETAGLFKDLVIFSDFSDKSFPSLDIVYDYILPERLKKNLNLPDFEKRVSRVRMELFRVIAQSKRIIFTYPNYDGRERKTKSIFAFDKLFSVCQN
ncbi:MAG: exodeoxyribonuclease V subunit gamma [bacterium]|nr:exodeoxyribonuclease V subunit gamma [bacterium]